MKNLGYRLRNWEQELKGAGVLAGVRLANRLGAAAGHGALGVRVFHPATITLKEGSIGGPLEFAARHGLHLVEVFPGGRIFRAGCGDDKLDAVRSDPDVQSFDRKLKHDYGTVSRRVVTTAGVNAMRDQCLGTFTLANFKYHEMGTGNTAEAVGDTLLVTYVETRSTGTQVSGGTGAYQTVATITATTTRAIVEHGVFSVVTSNTATLLDRSVFSVINLLNGDSIQFTYTITWSAGG